MNKKLRVSAGSRQAKSLATRVTGFEQVRHWGQIPSVRVHAAKVSRLFFSTALFQGTERPAIRKKICGKTTSECCKFLKYSEPGWLFSAKPIPCTYRIGGSDLQELPLQKTTDGSQLRQTFGSSCFQAEPKCQIPTALKSWPLEFSMFSSAGSSSSCQRAAMLSKRW